LNSINAVIITIIIIIIVVVVVVIFMKQFLPRDASAERGNATVSRPSVCLSVCPSVCDV